VATDPCVKGGADRALKGLERRQAFIGEEGGLDVGIGHEFGVVAVLFRELIATVVDNVLEVGANR
jgi:hypothetical protein